MKLYETITATNWHKGGTANSDWSRQCVMSHAASLYPSPLRWRVLDGLNIAAKALFPERARISGLQPVAAVNDHPDTTLEDILRLCKVADV